jgi:hypothetical protein
MYVLITNYLGLIHPDLRFAHVSKRPGIRSCLHAGLAKTPYWLGQYSFYMSLLQQVLPDILQKRNVKPTLRSKCDFDHLKLALNFVRVRYLYGLAVLDQDIKCGTWSSVDKPLREED